MMKTMPRWSAIGLKFRMMEMMALTSIRNSPILCGKEVLEAVIEWRDP